MTGARNPYRPWISVDPYVHVDRLALTRRSPTAGTTAQPRATRLRAEPRVNIEYSRADWRGRR